MTDASALIYDDERDYGASSDADARLPLLLGYKSHVKKGFYPAVLRGFLAGPQLYDPSYSAAMDSDAYEVVLRDPVVRQCVDIRLRASAGREWRCHPGEDTEPAKRLASIVEDALGNIARFTEARYELAAAVLRGTSYALIRGRRRWCKLNGIRGYWWVPTRIDDIDPRRFRWANDPSTGRQRLEIAEVKPERTEEWHPVPKGAALIRVVYNDEESRLGHGRGLLDALYHVAWAKGETQSLLLEAVAMHARGVIQAKINGMRTGSESTATRATQWLEAIEYMRNSGAVVYDDQDEMSFVPGGDSGINYCLEAMRYFDDEIRTLLLGSSLPFGGGGSRGQGSMARAREEGEVHESTVQYDRDKLNEDITRDLVGAFLRRNRIEIQAQALGEVLTPEFDSIHERKRDPEERIKIATDLLGMGEEIQLRLDEVMEAAGYTVPGPGDEVIKGGQAQQSASPFGGMFMDRSGAVK